MPELATVDEAVADEAQTSSSTLAVLKAAEAWLSDPARWTTGSFSRDARGHGLGVAGISRRRHDVSSTCAVGAIMLNTRIYGSTYNSAIDALQAELGERTIPSVNDYDWDAYQQIMAAFRRAITKLEAAAVPVTALVA